MHNFTLRVHPVRAFQNFTRRNRASVLQRTLLSALLSAALLILQSTPLSAQQSSAAINGIVTDPTGSSVEGATISLTAVDTSITRTAVSNSSGAYTFVNILPAQYTLKASKEGFNTISQPQFEMYVNQTATYDFHLAVGSTQQTVTVEAAAAEIQSSTSELGTVINEKAVNELPLNGRNFTQLLQLTPGASPVSVAQNSGGGGGFAGNAIGTFTFPAMNGQRNRSNMFLLDGANDLGSFIGNYNFAPIIDTVQEFKVQSHNDEAQFGQALGGIVNVVTKSGTNLYHGSAWEFLRNQVLDARNFFAATRNPLQQNQFGAAVGGPVWIPKLYDGKNKTFFFGGYEGFRQKQAASNPILVPTPTQLTGNLSGDPLPFYNPFTTRPDPAHPGQFLRDPFAGNIIPANLINPASAEWAKLYPAANGSPVAGYNATDSTPIVVNQNAYQIRIDQVFGDHDILFGRYSYYNQPFTQSNGMPGAVSTSNLTGYNYAIHETHTFGPTTVLDTHFARNYGDDNNTGNFPNAPAGFANDLITAGFVPNFISNYQGGVGPLIPSVGISGYAGAGQTIQDTRIADTWQFGGDFTKILGRHNLKMGADFATNITRSPIYNANVGFATYETANLESPAGTGDALASFLLGVPDNAGRRNVLETTHGGWVNGGYFQDQWKVSNRLTINLGIRYDVTLWPIYGTAGTPDGYVGDLNLNNGTYILARVPGPCTATVGYPCIPGGPALPPHVVVTDQKNGAIYHNDYNNWQGRFGFAYKITNTTVARGGWGRFYDEWNSVIQLAQNYEGTWPDIGQLLGNSLNQTIPTVPIGNPFNQGSAGGVEYPAANPFGQVQWFVDPTAYHMPYSDQWNIGIEQQVQKNTVISVAYVGAHSLQLNLGGYKNVATYPAPGDAAAVAARQPYPYIQPSFYDQSIGQSSFNALEFKVEHRGSGDLTYLVSYTFSKSLDLACSGSFGAEGCELQNPYNIHGDRSVSGFNIPNNFTASFNWQIPFGKGKKFNSGNGFIDYALGYWQVNGLLSLYSGVPFDITVSAQIPNTGTQTERANLVLRDPYVSNKGPNGWLNPNAFATPPNYTFGTLGRNALVSDWTKNFDFSLFKTFPIKERYSFEFRAESFNISNTATFGTPNTNLSAVNFGTITYTKSQPRIVQFGLKFLF